MDEIAALIHGQSLAWNHQHQSTTVMQVLKGSQGIPPVSEPAGQAEQANRNRNR